MREYSQDILTWISDMQYSTTVNTEQKMELILSDFFAEIQPKTSSNRILLKEKLSSADRNQFNKLVNDSKNLKLLNLMSNICYKKINREQRGLGVFMDILYRACEE